MCLCGNTTITPRDGFANKKSCCGSIHCVVEDSGRGICPGGIVCESSDATWSCGDTMVSSDKQCQCGDEMSRVYPGYCGTGVAYCM